MSAVLFSMHLDRNENRAMIRKLHREIGDLRVKLAVCRKPVVDSTRKFNYNWVPETDPERIIGEAKIPAREPEFEIRTMTVSAYCPCILCCGSYSDGVTATGADAFTVGVAVDPKLIAYGTLLEIPGYGKAIADDCGGLIKGDHIDVRFNSHQTAKEWGVKVLKVKIYKDN
jgi:3D (Asp-Asp-Asp) domain-containing protein